MLAFIDESGDHNLDLALSDNIYNIFVLGAVLIDDDVYKALDTEFREFKKSFFGAEDFIVHTKELTRPTNTKSDPRNSIMRIPQRRAEFYDWINAFISRSKIRAVFTVIQKVPFYHKYKTPFDPYELAFENILNRILYYGKDNQIDVYPECRETYLDRKLQGEFAKYSIAGTQFHSGEEITRRIRKFECRHKNTNMSGLQFADLLVNPVGRHFLGFPPKPAGNEVPYEVVREKLAGSEKLSITVLP